MDIVAFLQKDMSIHTENTPVKIHDQNGNMPKMWRSKYCWAT